MLSLTKVCLVRINVAGGRRSASCTVLGYMLSSADADSMFRRVG